MRSLRQTLAALLLAAVSSTAAANITIVHPEPRAGSALDLYAIDLIEFLAEKSGESVTLQTFQGQIGSGPTVPLSQSYFPSVIQSFGVY
jgi:hypothetical protein